MAVVVDVGLESHTKHGHPRPNQTLAALLQTPLQASHHMSRNTLVQFPGRKYEIGKGEVLHQEVSIFREAWPPAGARQRNASPWIVVVDHANDLLGIHPV